MASPQVLNFKIAVSGSGGVGKSCITIQFVQSVFVETWDPTIEDSYQKQMKIENEIVMVDILDTAGQEEYKALRDEYMRSSNGFILVFDVTNRKSFDELTEFRKHILRAKENSTPCILVVANKCDLPEEERKVSNKEAAELCKSWNVPYIEASAKLRKNIDESFEEIVKIVLRAEKEKTGGIQGGSKLPPGQGNPNADKKKKGEKGDKKDCIIN